MFVVWFVGWFGCGSACEGGDVHLEGERFPPSPGDPITDPRAPQRFSFDDATVGGLDGDVVDEDHVGFVTRAEGDLALFLLVTCDQDLVSGGMRAEVSFDPARRSGEELWVAWDHLVPVSFAFPADYPAGEPWMLMGQFHDQPDVEAGQTWSDLDAESPPVLMAFGKRDGRTVMAVNYGIATGREQETVVDYPTGVWHRWTLHLRWSTGDDGFGVFSLDGEEVASFVGPNAHNDAGNFLKLGLYRSQDIHTDNVVLYDDLAVGSTASDVAPLRAR